MMGAQSDEIRGEGKKDLGGQVTAKPLLADRPAAASAGRADRAPACSRATLDAWAVVTLCKFSMGMKEKRKANGLRHMAK
jgi:hypothetical protein